MHALREIGKSVSDTWYGFNLYARAVICIPMGLIIFQNITTSSLWE